MGGRAVEALPLALCRSCGAGLVPPYRYCRNCGAPVGPPNPYPPYAYAPYARRDNSATIIAVVVVVVLVLSVALPAILYLMVSGLVRGPVTSRPVVTLIVTNSTSGSADLLVAGAQPASSAANYRVNLAVSGTYGTAISLPASAGASVPIYINGYSQPFTVRWMNVGGSGSVVGGDHFLVTYSTTLLSGTLMTFVLLWYDGSTVSAVAWSTP